jgi:hypothetical protein
MLLILLVMLIILVGGRILTMVNLLKCINNINNSGYFCDLNNITNSNSNIVKNSDTISID